MVGWLTRYRQPRSDSMIGYNTSTINCDLLPKCSIVEKFLEAKFEHNVQLTKKNESKM